MAGGQGRAERVRPRDDERRDPRPARQQCGQVFGRGRLPGSRRGTRGRKRGRGAIGAVLRAQRQDPARGLASDRDAGAQRLARRGGQQRAVVGHLERRRRPLHGGAQHLVRGGGDGRIDRGAGRCGRRPAVAGVYRADGVAGVVDGQVHHRQRPLPREPAIQRAGHGRRDRVPLGDRIGCARQGRGKPQQRRQADEERRTDGQQDAPRLRNPSQRHLLSLPAFRHPWA